ncbi:lysoplasmalogenase family protein [Parerythrobacter aurantius]|uniref:lysoplasmalogenase family protein n=1 Tax=Parerythrobacter aurantius TaxID=3127706 RepID=UPI003246AA35
MSHHALIEERPWLLASIAAAVAFYFLRDNSLGGIQLMALKGAGVALLAVYAFRRSAGRDGLLLTAYLALGALGDALMEIGALYGGPAFFAGHVAAIALYLRNRRPSSSGSRRATGGALLLLTPVVSFLLSGSYEVGVYGLALGGMAAGAWMSRFSRYRVGMGAVLFVMSDLLIFSEMGSFDLSPLPHYLIWPLYYLGQLLIAVGVVQTLLADRLETAWMR